jgi:hypothetical protein
MSDALDTAPQAGAFLSVRQYAEYAGVAPSTISRQIADGIITTEGEDESGAYLIDPKKADAERAAKLNPAHVAAHDARKAAAAQPPATGGLHRAREAREGWAARRAQLDYEREVGNLLDKQEVHDAFFELGQMMREELARRAPLLAQQLVGMQDAATIQAALETADRAALESIIATVRNRLELEALAGSAHAA